MIKPLNISGYYSQTSAELIGNSESFRTLSELLVTDRKSLSLSLSSSSTKLMPNERLLSGIMIYQLETFVEISTSQNHLVIQGAQTYLSVLAQKFRFLADQSKSSLESSNHIHIEYFPNHSYLAPSSLPLVATLKE